MSHEYYILFYSTCLLSSQTRLLTPGHTNPKRFEAIEVKQTEVTMRIEPQTSAALPIIRCTLHTELSRSQGNLAQNGAEKLTTSLTAKST